MRLHTLTTSLMLLLGISLSAHSNSNPEKTLRSSSDSLTARICRYMGYGNWKVEIKNIKKRGNKIDVIFGDDIMSWSWHEDSMEWLRQELSSELEIADGPMALGRLMCKRIDMEELVTPLCGNDGHPSKHYRYRIDDPRKGGATWPFVRKVGARRYDRGLSDRHIALWQSHGMIYNPSDSCWSWQRARLHRTVEDMYTQSYVLPFLIPMLENAGAYVITPRERDIQRHEVVCDNDEAFAGTRDSLTRRKGRYEERGRWSDGGVGFADSLRWYSSTTNPFRMGSTRICRTVHSNRASASAIWTADVPERGEYAVYISYRSFPESAIDARYTVHHLGGVTQFKVNQRRGAGTWIYLGTFTFAPGGDCRIELDNHSEKAGQIVCADAVRLGGGMGKVLRGGTSSGMPAYCEGALYSMVWAGIDSTLYCEWERDYTRDFASRGRWCKTMRDELDIPLDMALAFHTDAGTTPNDSLVGTLAIYTLKNEGSRSLPSGGDRMCSRTLADMVQSQIVNDLRTDYDPQWSRRMLWDKSYSECRTNDMPAMILELLSHQNFSDMKYGLDPSFRFTVCRSVYKGVLKFLSELYGCRYQVQPLPPHAFEARLDGDKVRLKWKSTDDPLESGASSEGFLIYTRMDDGAWNSTAIETAEEHITLDIEPGHLYSFKVEAWNRGGKSFPSEILSVSRVEQPKGKVLIVNNFDRVSAPAWVESPGYAGFESRFDSGVPYINDISYIGENYEFRRSMRWESDGNPGCGACWDNMAGSVIAGNSFDYPSVHGRSILELGYEFESVSREAFESMVADSSVIAVDLICGKQVTTMIGNGRVPSRYAVFPEALRRAISSWSEAGCSFIVSGSSISTDPFVNSTDDSAAEWAESVLGYRHGNSFGSYGNLVSWKRPKGAVPMAFHKSPNGDCYCVECPDALLPASRSSKVCLKYSGNGAAAGICYDRGTSKVISIGVPIETFCQESDRRAILSYAISIAAGGE